MIRKIALRNITEHRSKSLIVGGLIALGVTLLVLGNSTMDSISAGMRNTFTEQYSGDIFIFAPFEKESELSIFGTFGEDKPNALSSFADYEDELAKQDNIKLVSKMTVGTGALEAQSGERMISSFWGIDPTVWNESFAQHLIWHEGGLWDEGSASIALTKSQADDIEAAQNAPVNIGDNVLISVMSENGIRIREMSVSGIFEFKTISSPQMKTLSLVDMRTSQALLSLDDIRIYEVDLSDAESKSLGSVTDENLFGDAGLFGESESSLFTTSENVSMEDLNAELSETLQRSERTTESYFPQYHFAVILLDNPGDLEKTQAQLTVWVEAQGLDWVIGDWENAAGFVGTMADSIKIVLNGLVMLIAFVSMLIIMNTLVISVTERLQEIGTMRAIGAQKLFVRKLILSETLMLAVYASLIGLLTAIAVIGVVNIYGIPANSDFLRVLFGGDALYPTLSMNATLQGVGLMTLASLLACLYPLGIALKVSPLKAMQG